MKKTSVGIESVACSIKKAGVLQFSSFQSINYVCFFWTVQRRLCTLLSLLWVLEEPTSAVTQVSLHFSLMKGTAEIQVRIVESLVFLQSPWVFLLLVSMRVVYVYKEITVSSESFGIRWLAGPRRSYLTQFLRPTKVSSISLSRWSCWQWGGTVAAGRRCPRSRRCSPALQRPKAWCDSAAVVPSSATRVLETEAGRVSPMFVTINWCWSGAVGGQGLDQLDAPCCWQWWLGKLIEPFFSWMHTSSVVSNDGADFIGSWAQSTGLLSVSRSFLKQCQRKQLNYVSAKQTEMKRRARSLALKQRSCFSGVQLCWEDMLYFKGIKWLH